jgi:hypothetical protein
MKLMRPRLSVALMLDRSLASSSGLQRPNRCGSIQSSGLGRFHGNAVSQQRSYAQTFTVGAPAGFVIPESIRLVGMATQVLKRFTGP